jgi:uncharacterized membrane protein YhaH (DUF805 family)
MTGVGDWFSFSGRITRGQYWLWYVLLAGLIQLAFIVVGLLLHVRVGLLLPDRALGMHPGPGVALHAVLSIVLLIGGLAGAAKRLHDRDRSGWFQLIVLIPVIGALWLALEVGFLRGTFGPHRFGPDPLEGQRF